MGVGKMAKRSDRSHGKIYDVVTVGERGQVVIPVQARKELSIGAGEKLVVIRGPVGNVLAMAKLDDMTDFMGRLIEGFGKIREKIK